MHVCHPVRLLLAGRGATSSSDEISLTIVAVFPCVEVGRVEPGTRDAAGARGGSAVENWLRNAVLAGHCFEVDVILVAVLA